MDTSVHVIIFYVLLIDSIGASLVAWLGLGGEWYKKKFGAFARLFPATRGWATFYLVIVLYIGYLLSRMGAL